MSYDVTETYQFEKDLEFYVKKKKCVSIIQDIRNLKKELEQGNFMGDEINDVGLPVGEDSYKIRIADTTHKIGKRGGFRLVYYVIKNNKDVFLLTIYHKKDKSDISKASLRQLIKEYCT